MPGFCHITPTMELSDDNCYQALITHDTRFDGAFYVAVRSTKIYCRPVCRVKPALQKNCSFYKTAAAAELAGYRPCLKCRPELAPGSSTMEAVSRLANLAQQRIDEGALTDGSIADLADELGVTDRHLRRVLKAELGVSPVELAQTQRLHLTKRLLTDTQLSITDIAFASGFSSLRRFNALFKERYRLEPRRFRSTQSKKVKVDGLTCYLSYRPPLAWRELLEFLSARAVTGVEFIAGNTYHRTVRIGKSHGIVSVSPSKGKNALEVRLTSSLTPVLVKVLSRLKQCFDLNSEPLRIARQLGKVAEKNPGLRLPGAFDGFEVAVRAILGQQVTVKAATTLAGRFAEKFGEPFRSEMATLTRLTPTAERVAAATVDDIARLGIIAKRAESIIALAKGVAIRQINLEPTVDVEKQISTLVALPGIGEWTAQYIAMRAFQWPDAFPHTDLGVMKALGTKDKNKILTMAESWRPWRSYAVMHLWRSLA